MMFSIRLVTTGALWLFVFMATRSSPAAPLPRFFSSDPDHDALLQDLFVRHLRADISDSSLRKPGGPVPGANTVMLWRDWEIDELFWYDFGPGNCPLEDRPFLFRQFLETIPQDRFGYVFAAHNNRVPPADEPHTWFGMGWPFPEYPLSLGESVGWEWNGGDTEGWSAINVDAQVVSEGRWLIESARVDPHLVSPSISVDWFHAPFIALSIHYTHVDGASAQVERCFQVFWETSDAPGFAEERSVLSRSFPVIPIDEVDAGLARRVWLPMYLHPLWRGKRITRIRIDPILNASDQGRYVRAEIDFVRLDYDTRHAVNNPDFVRASARKFMWDGDGDWLRGQLARMRAATLFMLDHLRGREEDVLEQSFFVGHDGIGWSTSGDRRIGHGVGTNYFDLLPMGPRGLHSSVKYYLALRAMAGIEAFVEAHPELDTARPAVIGPDGVTPIGYEETAASLSALADAARTAIHQTFWNPSSGRYDGWVDENGNHRDYGYTHFNLEALAAGIPDAAAAASVLSWLDGDRVVAGDTSTGEDIYRWDFAARISTRRNRWDYFWGWAGDSIEWGEQVQDGGAVLFTTFFDMKARLAFGDVEGAWRVWERMLSHHQRVLAHGGVGHRFYRDYYEAHPEEGTLQGGGTAGGLGLDEEFVENLLAPSAWVLAWLGVDAPAPGVFQIAPSVPAALSFLGVDNIMYRGNRFDLRAAPGSIDLSGSDVTNPGAATLRLVFRGDWSSQAVVLRNGQPDPGTLTRGPEALVLDTALGADLFEVDDPGESDGGQADAGTDGGITPDASDAGPLDGADTGDIPDAGSLDAGGDSGPADTRTPDAGSPDGEDADSLVDASDEGPDDDQVRPDTDHPGGAGGCGCGPGMHPPDAAAQFLLLPFLILLAGVRRSRIA